jgi:hypothetical protein
VLRAERQAVSRQMRIAGDNAGTSIADLTRITRRISLLRNVLLAL